ncbi:ATP-binding protein [Streptomyces sp. NPDC058284]|uniref:ATP-binding protein n=1 Tax=unclassified Streptomyces TaxID=2593676 RepID=UPI00365268E3
MTSTVGPDPHRTAVTNSLGDSTVYGASVQAGTITDLTVHTRHEPRYEPPPPLQAPPVPPAWVDREQELGTLLPLADTPHRAGIRIIALSGGAGIGKSSLAARLLNDLHGSYPGGQLYVNLRSYEPEDPRSVTDTLGQLLRALRSGPLPAAEDELAA